MIEIRSGSILDFEGDAIVNPANGFLRHGAGLAKIIANAAQAGEGEGARAWRAEQASTPTIATGNVAVTGAGNLPYKGVIHAVGPVWNGGAFCEDTLLWSAHVEAVAAAIVREWDSIAFPAISCGLFGFPVERAAPIAISGVLAASLFDVDVTFYPFGYEAEFTRALQEATS
jgi:O-acetyl-ADP-ribose deacetylase (regulator of RNase III)